MTVPESLVAALVSLQSRLPNIERSQTAEVEMRNGGKFKYAYADLAAVSQAILPMLSEVGLCFTCGPTLNAAGTFVLRWALIHVSGERETGEYPLPTGTPQQVGSGVTYARRYTLAAVVGLSMVDDDDGQAAAVAERPAPAQRREASRRREASEPDEGPRPQSVPQQKKLHALFGQLGLSGDKDRAERLRLCSVWVGREISTTQDLSYVESARVISALEARLAEPPAGHDDGPSA